MFNLLEYYSEADLRHSVRVAEYSYELLTLLGVEEKTRKDIYIAAMLHDVGKVRIADSILEKTGKLTETEFKAVKKHAYFGYKILKSSGASDNVCTSVLYHHENYDGSGYSRGVGGESIPLGARIIKICDVYDAINSDRIYHKGKSAQVTLAIMDSECQNFDAEMYQTFKCIIIKRHGVESQVG